MRRHDRHPHARWYQGFGPSDGVCRRQEQRQPTFWSGGEYLVDFFGWYCLFLVVFFCSFDWLIRLYSPVSWQTVLKKRSSSRNLGEDSCDYKHGSSHSIYCTYILLLYASRSTLKRMQTWCLFGQDISSTSRTVPPSDFNLLHCGLCVPWNSGPLRKFGGMGDNMYHSHETMAHLRS